jgi:hypothetical protein
LAAMRRRQRERSELMVTPEPPATIIGRQHSIPLVVPDPLTRSRLTRSRPSWTDNPRKSGDRSSRSTATRTGELTG